MKNYLVFAYYIYYPSGGMNDFKLDFDNLEQAINFLDKIVSDEGWGMIGHIYSMKERKIVYKHE